MFGGIHGWIETLMITEIDIDIKTYYYIMCTTTTTTTTLFPTYNVTAVCELW